MSHRYAHQFFIGKHLHQVMGKSSSNSVKPTFNFFEEKVTISVVSESKDISW